MFKHFPLFIVGDMISILQHFKSLENGRTFFGRIWTFPDLKVPKRKELLNGLSPPEATKKVGMCSTVLQSEYGKVLQCC